MLQIHFSRESEKFLKKLTIKKHIEQIKRKLEALRKDPFPQDSKQLHSDLNGRYRVDCGEYRIIYKLDDKENPSILFILLYCSL